MDFKFYLSLFMRRLPWFLLLTAVGIAAGLTLARVLPPVYSAQARLVVESEQIPDGMAASTVQTAASEQLEIVQQRILTRAKLLDMADRLDIYGTGDAPPRISADEIVADLRDRIKIVTTGGGSARGPAQATIVTVSFQAVTAALAANVTNEVVTMILQEDVAMRTGVSRQTLDFFVQEVARLDQELAQRSTVILEFKQQNQDALPDSLDFRRSQQAAEQTRLVQLEREEALLKERRARLVTLFETTGRVDTVADNQTPEQKQMKSLQDQLSSLLAVLSPQNPRVKVLEAQIASLEQVISAQTGAAVQSGDGQALSAYDIQLSDLDGQMTAIADQKAEIATTMDTLATSIAATPGNAIALSTLERDYANIRVQYDQAVANKARAETGDLIEALSKGQRISVIEQATAPRVPTSPNRPLIAAAGVGAGMFAGLALVVLLELLNTAIRRPVDLTAKLGVTAFATLPYIRTKQEIRRRRLIILAAFMIVLIGVPVALWALDRFVMPLDLLLNQILQRVGLAMLSPEQTFAGQSLFAGLALPVLS